MFAPFPLEEHCTISPLPSQSATWPASPAPCPKKMRSAGRYPPGAGSGPTPRTTSGLAAAVSVSGRRPFADFIEAARQGRTSTNFLLLEEDGDEVYVGIDRIEAVEIPLGVLMPDLYGSEYPPAPENRPSTLEEMEAMGQA